MARVALFRRRRIKMRSPVTEMGQTQGNTVSNLVPLRDRNSQTEPKGPNARTNPKARKRQARPLHRRNLGFRRKKWRGARKKICVSTVANQATSHLIVGSNLGKSRKTPRPDQPWPTLR